MLWELRSDRPIYLQLIEQMQLRIVSGVYSAGEKLPPVRDLAAEASVNPNTMQKALGELERDGLVYTQRTAGRFITEDAAMIEQAKQRMAKENVEEFFARMRQIGYDKEETLQLLKEVAKEEEKQ